MSRTIHAAGVLPFAIAAVGEDKADRIMLLLGRERERRHFEHGGLWADFGGGIKSGAIETTAAREFYEETMGVIETSRASTLQSLRGGAVVAVDSFFEDTKSYRTYVKRVPMRPYPLYFKQRMKTPWCDMINVAPQLFKTNGRLKRDATEKSELRWISIRDALGLPLRPEFRRALDAILNDDVIVNCMVTGIPIVGCYASNTDECIKVHAPMECMCHNKVGQHRGIFNATIIPNALLDFRIKV